MQKSLKKQVFSGLVWRGSTDIVQQLLQIVFTIILARLLTKGDFGLVAMAMLVNRFVKSITNISFGTAIVQSQTVTSAQISALFYIQLSINVLLTLTVFFGADIAASFFNEPELVGIIQVLSLLILMQSLQFPNIILRKKMEFKSFSIAQMSAMVISNVIAISLAFLGFGLWSLVWRLLLQSLIFGVLSFYYGQWKPISPDFKNLRPILNFGFDLLGRNVLYFFAENMIALMTGKFLGKEVMGLFNIAYNLAIVPASKIQNVLTSVLTSGFSKIQFQIERFKKNYSIALAYTSMFFIPLMLVLSAISTNLIPIVYGAEWERAGVLLRILSIVGLLRGLSHLVRTAIISLGNSRVVFYSSAIELIISLPIMYLTLQDYGIKGLIFAYLVGALAGLVFLVFYFDKLLSSTLLFIKSILKSSITGLFIFAVILSFNTLALGDVITLALKLVTASIMFITMLNYFENDLLRSINQKIKSIFFRKKR